MAFEFESLLAVFVVAYERSDIKLWYTINETKTEAELLKTFQDIKSYVKIIADFYVQLKMFQDIKSYWKFIADFYVFLKTFSAKLVSPAQVVLI